MAAPEIPLDDFARRFAQRAPRLMWFLGAGASTAAGVPSAEDMCWEFKQTLFVSQRRVSPRSVEDLGSPSIRQQLQAHVDALGRIPRPGAPGEYAALFEETFPAEADRRSYMDTKVAGARPSYGHLALAALMRSQQTRLVWTTNFDALVADASAQVHGTTTPLTTVTLDSPHLLATCLADDRWPIEVKLHGDFRSRRLKNTPDELRGQDVLFRRALSDTCRRFGLVVAGYSGRDDSIMDALCSPLGEPGAFPAGLFWLHRGASAPLPRVAALLAQAAAAGVEAGIVRIVNFDETLRDLVRLIANLDTTHLDQFGAARRRWSPAPAPSEGRGLPVVRLNALRITTLPSTCRRIVCSVGGHAQAEAAVLTAGVDALVARTRVGVLAFGSDRALRTAFEPFGIESFDLHGIETRRLWWDSGERGLLRAAVARALARKHGLEHVHRRNQDILAPKDPTAPAWAPLRTIAGALNGTVSGHAGLSWREGVSIRLDWAADCLWLLFDPRTVFDGRADDNKAAATDFARERTVRRYNRKLNELLDFWARMLGGDDLPALGITDGVDAVFRLSSITGFSRRAGR